eukprot:gene3020-3208_t
MNLAESSRRFTSMRRENSRNDLEELLAIPSESLSVFELEKEIVKRRDKLLWSLRDPIIYNEFIQFMNHSKSVGFLWIINLFFSVAFIPAAMKAMYGKQDYITIWATIDFTIVTTTWLSGCLVCGCLDEKSVFRRTAKALLTYTTATSLEALADSLVAIFYLSVVIGRSLELIQRTVAGQCKTLDWSESFSCNPNANVGNFPMESFCIVASIPVFIVVTRALDRTGSGTKTNSPDDSDDYHPASPTKLCYRIEDEVITSEPDNYQSPVTMMLRQLSMAHISRKSTSSRLSMKSGQVSVMGSQWFREATSTNSRGLDVMLNSMVTKRSIISTNKVAPSPPTSPTRHTQRTVNSRQGMNQLENPSDNDSFQETEEYTQQRRRRSPRRHIPHRRMSTASNASVASQASQARGTASAKEKSGYMGGRETHDHGMMTSQLHGANVEGGGNTNSKNNSKRTVDVGNTSSSSPKAVSIHAKPPANQTQNLPKATPLTVNMDEANIGSKRKTNIHSLLKV